MPFDKELYAVNFGNRNLTPHVKPRGWPDMVLSPASSTETAEIGFDPLGLNLLLKPTTPSGARIDVKLTPPGGVDIDTRLLMHATFDLAWATGHKVVGGPPEEDLPIATPSPDESDLAGSAGSPYKLAAKAVNLPGFTVPENWAVSLNLSPRKSLSNEDAIVTCQFHRKGAASGVRLNTPTSLQFDPASSPPQRDQASYLLKPLDYLQFQEGLIVVPDVGSVRPRIAAPIFTLEHSFCGYNGDAINHTVGCGFLNIAGLWMGQLGDARDHRVYTTGQLKKPTIEALGVSVATQTGVGRMSVRLRTFSLFENPKLGG